MGKHKIPRNSRCPCGSGKRYKSCCLLSDWKQKIDRIDKYENGHEISSDKVKHCVNNIVTNYPKNKVIDVSNILNNETYRLMQIENYRKDIIMVAERNIYNNEVFSTRAPETIDIIVLYHGAYRCFKYDNLELARDDLDKMIIGE